MTGRTDASGTTTYGYDKDGRLAGAADPITGRTDTYGYDNDDRPASITYGTGGPVRIYTYGDTGNLASDTITGPTGQTVASTSYVYNPDHQIQTKTTTGYAGAGTTTNSYDWAGRLKTQTIGSSTKTYTFDDSGNLTSDGTHTYTYDERDRLTSDGTSDYTYSPRGTLTAKTAGSQTTDYAFDAFDQLTSAGSTSYRYDALNRLIDRDGTAFAYSGTGNDPASDGTATYSRDTDGDLIGIVQGGSKSAAIVDQNHDDLTAALNPATSTLTGSAAYDAYGNTTGTAGALPGLGYQSGYTDPATGLVDMHARWFNSTTGGFTSRDTWSNDPTPDSANANPYAYGAGDPIDTIDPTGHCGIIPTSWGCAFHNGVRELVPEACVFWKHIQGQLHSDDVCLPRCYYNNVTLIYRRRSREMPSAIHLVAYGTTPGGVPGVNIDKCLENNIQGRVLNGSACRP